MRILKSILILSGVPYDFMKQRPQHFADFFARNGYRVLFIGLGEKEVILSEAQYNSLNFDSVLEFFSEEISTNLFVVNNIYQDNHSKNLSGMISILLNEVDTIFVEHPIWVDHLPDISTNTKLIFDCIDDWESFVHDLDYGLEEGIISRERKIASISDLVIVSAKRLYSKMYNFNNNIFYLPNGVNVNDYEKSQVVIPQDIMNIHKKIVFFMGAIAGWVDIDLIAYLASKRPNYAFVFVGDKVKSSLPENGNIFFLGRKKYGELANYLSHAKVAIIPFKENNLTAAVTPLKYYEYISAGVPVVSTMLPDLIHLKCSKVVSNKEEFLSAIDYYMELDESQYNKVSQLSKETSKKFDWGNLLKPICNFIDTPENFNLPKKESVVANTIESYESYKENKTIKNELLTLYNLTEQYEKTKSLYKFEELIKGDLDIDYNQIALAYYKMGEIYPSKELLRIFIQKNKKLIFESNYFNTVMTDNDKVYHAFLLKTCERHYDALKILDNSFNNPIALGLIASVYFDIGEYQLAIECVSELLPNVEDLTKVLDPYKLIDMIDYLVQQGEIKFTEELCLDLLGKGPLLEEILVKKLGEIYLFKYSN